MHITELPAVNRDLIRPSHTLFNFSSTEEIERGDVVALGVPFDGLSTERLGSADAPDALRYWSRKIGRYSVRDGNVRIRAKAGKDLGDVNINRFALEDNYEAIHSSVDAVVRASAVPLLLGGDHSITYPSVAAVARKFSDLIFMQIDSHHDATDPAEWKCRYNHGTFVRNLVAEGHLRGDQVVQIGTRDFQWTESGALFLANCGARLLPGIQAVSNPECLQQLLQELTGRPLYLSIDMDCVDPAFAPGTGEPMVGGFTSREVIDLVRTILHAQTRIIGADLVEVVPRLDPAGMTCALACHLLAEIVDHVTNNAKLL